MSRSPIVVAALVGCFIYGLTVQGQSSADKGRIQLAATNGFELVQRSDSNGTYNIRVSKNAIRCQSEAYGFILAACAPDWKVKAWRPDRKTWGDVSLDQFLKSDLLFMNHLSSGADLGSPTSTRKTKKAKVDAFVYTFAPVDTGGAGLFSYTDKEDEASKTSKPRPELTCLNAGFANETTRILSKLYQLPALPGLPLELALYGQAKSPHYALQTTKITAAATLSKSDLLPPHSYSQTVLRKRFFVSDSGNALMHDMYDGMTRTK